MMKKVILGLIAAAAMTSCIKRQEVTTDQNSNLGSATISGTVYANLNNTNDTTNSQFIPDPGNNSMSAGNLERAAGAQVIATISSNQLDPDNINSETVTASATTDGNGAYSLSIPAANENVTVTVEFVTFNGTISYDDGAGNNPITLDSEPKTFTGDTRTTTVRNGESTRIDFVY